MAITNWVGDPGEEYGSAAPLPASRLFATRQLLPSYYVTGR